MAHAPPLQPIKAGEVIPFEPAELRHFLIMPTQGERFLLSLMLTPSPSAWRGAFAETPRSRYCERNARVWPAHARDPLEAIGQDGAAPSCDAAA